ncbi:MAG TPA: peptidase M56, BlaR1, partial [Sphingobacteriaceae bacterium]|nr:peptidase M56, BlaR1 [Sphingobacteriaceae bacterium]
MIPYSLHVAIILSVCLGFYKLLLQKQTYYQLNRLVLLTCLLLAFILPILSVPQQFSMRNANLIANENDFESDVSVMHTSTKKHADLEKTEVFNSEMVIKWVGWFYWFGVAAFGLSFLLQAVVLFYQSHKNKWVKDGIYKIVELETNKAPCSFGNYIFINPTKYDWDTYNRILLHEKIHVKERHSIDLVLSELMLVFQWFNPMAWFYR